SSASSAVQNLNDSPTGSVTISGELIQGQTLTASNTLADLDGLGEITYTWKADDLTLGTGSSFTLSQAEVSKEISVVASYSDGHGMNESVASTSTASIANIDDPSTGILSIVGAIEEGSSVSASVTSLLDLDGAASISSYGWEVSVDGSTAWTAAPGTANAANYAIPSDQSLVGKYLRFSITTNDGTILSSSGSLVANVDDAAIATLSISGAVKEGASISASISSLTDDDGTASISSYAWEVSSNGTSGWTAAPGLANTANYSIASDQSLVGKYLRFKITSSDELGGAATHVSASYLVNNVNDVPTGTVSISGSATPGQTLTASHTLADADGLGTITYTWKDRGITIGTGATYLVSAGSRQISVTASYTDGFGVKESLTSSAMTSASGQTYEVLGLNNRPNTSPALTTLSDDSFMIAYKSISVWTGPQFSSSLTYRNEYNSNYNQIFSGPPIYLNDPSISSLRSGYIITYSYSSTGSTGSDIYAETNLSINNSIRTKINTYSLKQQSKPSVAELEDGKVVITWTSQDQDGQGMGIYARILNSDGSFLSSEFLVNSGIHGDQFDAEVVSLQNGAFAIAWSSLEGLSKSVYMKIFDSQGANLSGDILITDQVACSNPQITSLSDGSLVIVWSSDHAGSSDIYLQRFTPEGISLAEATRVNSYTSGTQNQASLCALVDGGYVISWTSVGQDSSEGGIYAQRFHADGSAYGSEFRVNTYTALEQSHPTLTAFADGGYLIAWQSYKQYNSNFSIYSQRYDKNSQPIGTTTWSGMTDVDNIFATEGSDTINLIGTGDTVLAKAGNDLIGVTTTDFALIDGGEGYDQLTSSINLDFSLIDDQKIQNIEALVLTSSGLRITLSDSDVLALTDDRQTLKIFAASGYVSELIQLDSGWTETEFTASYVTLQKNQATLILHRSLDRVGTNDAPMGSVRINGTPTQGQTLTASNTLADADGLGTISYLWLDADGHNYGSGDQLLLTQEHVGKTLLVQATYVDGHGQEESPSSSAVLIANINENPSGSLGILGSMEIGAELVADTSSIADADGLGTFHYQWWVDGNPIGDDSSSYILQAADLGKAIGLEISYTDLCGTEEKLGFNHAVFSKIKNIFLKDTEIADKFLAVSDQITVNESGWIFSGSSTGRYGQLSVAADGKYTFTPNEAKINLLPLGDFEESYSLVASKDGRQESFTLLVSVQGRDDADLNFKPQHSYSSKISISESADGGWVSSWLSSSSYYQQEFTSAGTRKGSETSIATPILAPLTAKLVNGGRIELLTVGNDLHQQLISPSGVIQPSSLVYSYTTGYWSNASVTALKDDSWVITWTATDGLEPYINYTSSGIWQQHFEASGLPAGPQYRINGSIIGTQDGAVTATLADGGWVTAWVSTQSTTTDGIFMQRFDANGHRLSLETLVNAKSTNARPAITALSDGGWIIAWGEYSNGIFMQRYDADGHPISHSEQSGSIATETLTGSAGAKDLILGIGAGDSAFGLAGDDIFEINSNDIALVDGGDGDDTLRITQSIDFGIVAPKLTSIEHLRVDSILADGTIIDTNVSRNLEIRAAYTFTGTNDGTGHNIWTDATGRKLLVDSDIVVAAHSATATLSFSGKVEEGTSIFASVSSLADQDGAPSIVSYTWEVSSNGSTGWTAAPGTTNTVNYAIPSDQSLVGQYLRFRITTNDGTILSSSGSLVANVNDAATATLSINGTVEEGASISASVAALADPDGAPLISSYVWQVSSDGISGWATAPGTANAANYAIPAAQVLAGKYLRFSITTNDGTVISSSSSLVANVNDPATASLSISGTVEEGASVSAGIASLSDPDGSTSISSCAWEVSSNGTSGWTAAPGTSNTASYAIPSDQSLVGKYLRFSISTDDGTVLNSSATLVANVNDPATAILSISGSVQEGGYVTTSIASLIDPDGNPSISSYAWEVSSNGSTGWTAAPGLATSANYAIPSDQSLVGKYLRFSISTNDGTILSSSGSVVANVNDPASATLAITGRVEEGASVSASISSLVDPDGTSSIVSYTWEVSSNGYTGWTTAPGTANTVNYAIPSDQSLVGKYLRFSITTDDGTLLSHWGSYVSNVNDAATATLSIFGTVEEGASVSASVLALADEDGTPSISSYSWQVSSDGSTGWTTAPGIAGTSNYAIPSDQSLVGKYLRFSIRTNDGTTLNSSNSFVTNINDSATGDIIILGTPNVGQTLSVISALSDGDGLGTISYTWLADGSAIGTGDSLILSESQIGQSISVLASYTDAGGTFESRTSSPIPLNGSITGSVVISGWVEVGQILTASNTLADSDGLGPITYTWFADGNAIGSGSSITLTQAQLGKSIYLAASYIDGSGASEKVNSLAQIASDSPKDLRVNTYTASNQVWPSATLLKDGGWVVTWTSYYQDGGGGGAYGQGVYSQRYASNGMKIGREKQVNTFTYSDQMDSTVAALEDGGYVISWSSHNQDYDQNYHPGIFQQRYDAHGNPLGAERQVNTFSEGTQQASTILGLKNGGWVVAWESGYSIRQQVYSADGSLVGYETIVSSWGDNHEPYLTALSDGGWRVYWETSVYYGPSSYGPAGVTPRRGIVWRDYSATGDAIGNEVFSYSTFTDNSTHIGLQDGGWLDTWSADGQDGSGMNIYSQRFDSSGNRVGGNLYAGSASQDQFFGTRNSDEFISISTGDRSYGLAGDDSFVLASHDFALIDGGAGQDKLTLAGNLDLTALDDAKLTSIEIIDLNGKNLALNLAEVLNLSSALTLKGSGTLDLLDTWTPGATANGYTNYTQDAASLLVDVHINVV
ncbi:MAG: hypothetical protein RL095_3424, partial [Verrucomicrobiota bacterium]